MVGRSRSRGSIHARCRDLVEVRSEEHTSELQSQSNLVCRLLLEKKKRHTSRRRVRHGHLLSSYLSEQKPSSSTWRPSCVCGLLTVLTTVPATLQYSTRVTPYAYR